MGSFSLGSLFNFEDPVLETGANGGEVPPVPIPNTEVKLTGADDTWLATAWNNRKTPTQIFLLSSAGRACGC